MSGGDLRYLISRKKRFTEAQTSKNLNIYVIFKRILSWLHDSGFGVSALKWCSS